MQLQKENYTLEWIRMYWMPLVLLIICIVEAAFFEKVPVNDGLGWDGAVYAEHTQFFFELLKEDKIDSYRLQRDLIPLFLNAILKTYHGLFLSGTAISGREVITAFLIVDTICIVFSGFILALLARKFQWSNSISCLAFVFLFVNFLY